MLTEAKIIEHIKATYDRELDFIKAGGSVNNSVKSIRLKFYCKRICKFIFSLLIGFYDLVLLFVLLLISKLVGKQVNLLFLARNFCLERDGKYKLRIASELFTESTIFINSSKELFINRVGGQKVYNIGLLIKIVSVIWCSETDIVARNYKAYRFMNNGILLFRSCFDKIYFYCHYDLNAFSLIFSKYRGDLTLVEIQHGSMINYPVYSMPSTIKVADIFYVRNLSTIEYLKTHINKNFICDYKLLKYPDEVKLIKPGLNILYASSLELNGFHSVFKEFIKSSNLAVFGRINLSIRLHPREKGKEYLFIEELKECNVNFWFDNADNWLIANAVQDLIVVSPWSSIIEEAVDNNYTTIIIDVTGHKRFKQLVDNVCCFYSNNLSFTINNIREDCA